MKTKLDTAIEMTRVEYKSMVRVLKMIQTDLSRGEIRDIRLSIDFDNGQPFWIINQGLADYDQRHYLSCGAGSISKRDKIRNEPCCDLLEDLITQCLDQLAYRGES